MFFRKIFVALSIVCVFVPTLALAVDPPATTSTTPATTSTTPKTTPAASTTSSDFGLTESSKAANLPQGGPDLMGMVARVIGTALSLIGVIFMVLFIYGGFIWMTAGGDSGKTKKAKDLMTSAVIGAILIFSAYFITKFVINELVSSTTIQSGTTTGTGTTTGGTTTGTGSTLWD